MKKTVLAAASTVLVAVCVMPAAAQAAPVVAPPANASAAALWKHASFAITQMPGLDINALTCAKIKNNVYPMLGLKTGTTFASVKAALDGANFASFVSSVVSKTLAQDPNPAHSGPDFQAVLRAAEKYYAAEVGQKANACGFVAPRSDAQVNE